MQRLNLDPSNLHKRLGDGYAEQQMVRDQIINLTGYHYLGDNRENLAQYEKLMDAGVAYAKQYGLVPGVALIPEQMQNLTSDIVWLVEKDVTTSDGSTQKVLVPP